MRPWMAMQLSGGRHVRAALTFLRWAPVFKNPRGQTSTLQVPGHTELFLTWANSHPPNPFNYCEIPAEVVTPSPCRDTLCLQALRILTSAGGPCCDMSLGAGSYNSRAPKIVVRFRCLRNKRTSRLRSL